MVNCQHVLNRAFAEQPAHRFLDVRALLNLTFQPGTDLDPTEKLEGKHIPKTAYIVACESWVHKKMRKFQLCLRRPVNFQMKDVELTRWLVSTSTHHLDQCHQQPTL